MSNKSLQEAVAAGEFTVTAELGTPKGTNIEEMVPQIDLLKDKVHAINVTDNPRSVMRISSLSVCRLIRDRGGEPILQMTCRDRNRLAQQADLLGAHVLGIRNVLCLTGDHVSLGDHPQAKPVFDLDSVQLIQMVQDLNAGRDWAGHPLNGAPDFYIGAIVTPEADPIEPQLLKFEKKVRAGARFFQTQAIFDLDNFQRFMEYARGLEVKVMAGIVLLVSTGMANYMNKNVPGIFVPPSLIDEVASAGKGGGVQKGVEIAARMIRQLKEKKICDGVHIMTIGKERLVPEILAAAG